MIRSRFWSARSVIWCATICIAACSDSEAPRISNPAAQHPETTKGDRDLLPRYVDDALCGSCHTEIASSFAAHGMAQSMTKAAAAKRIEDFASATYFHAPSKRHYEMRLQGTDLMLRRFQRDPNGAEIHVIERRIDWIIGSGNHVRAYAFREPGGELFAAPINWYTQEGRWGMAPGYDSPNHFGFTRLITTDCLACHDAYPLDEEGRVFSARADRSEVHPKELSSGIGCQRYHGPGHEHVQRAQNFTHDPAEIRAAIINPAHLSPERREEVCLQCHLQPTARRDSLPTIPGRGSFDFVPGERLVDHRAVLEFLSQHHSEVPFEINHHAYQLRRSACHDEQQRPLSCLLCHDPHGKAPLEQRAERVDAACATCHTMPADHATAWRSNAPRGGMHCADCHMPERRTEDVVHVQMTDHRIQRRSEFASASAGIEERAAPPADQVRPYPLDEIGSVHDAVALAEAARVDLPQARAALRRHVEHEPAYAATWTALGAAESAAGRHADAATAFESALALDPESIPAMQGAAGVYLLLQRAAEAEAMATRALDRSVNQPDLLLLRARARRAQGVTDGAREDLTTAVRLRPLFAEAWTECGGLEIAAGRFAAARDAYQRALDAEPRQRDAYAGLAASHERLGSESEMLRVLRNERALLPPYAPNLLRLATLVLSTSNDAVRNVELGLQCAAEASQLLPAHPEPRLWMAFAHFLADRAAPSEAELQRARLLGADEGTCLRLEAQLKRRGGRRAEADALDQRAEALRSMESTAPVLRSLLERAARSQR